MVLKAYRYRIYPSESQEILLNKTFGCCRFVFNHFLTKKQQHYKEHKKTLSYSECAKDLVSLKGENPWLREVSSVPLQQTLRHLESAFQRFYQRKALFPKHKKKFYEQSASFMNNAFTWKDGVFFLAKSKEPLKVRWSRRFEGAPTSVTISKDRQGKYYISFLVEEHIKPLPLVQKNVGIDLGLTHLVTTSDGKKENPLAPFRKQLNRLRRRQRAFSRKKKGSNNANKGRKNIAKLSAKIRDQRVDYLHKMSTALVSENQVICAENLKVKNMMKNKHLSRSIGDAGWGILLRFLDYKCAWYGRQFVQTDSYFPSSKQCSCCAVLNASLRLCDRVWTCHACHAEHDRDINAAVNIREEGLRCLNNHTVGHTGLQACGADVRPIWQTRGLSAVKQELGL